MDIAHKQTDKLLKEMEKKIKAEYRQASAEVEKKVEQYLESFKRKNEKQLQALKDGKITEKDYKDWWNNQVLIGERWTEMRDSLSEDYHNANNIAKSIVNGYMPEVYALNHNYATYDVERKSLMDTSYTLYSRDAVEHIMRENPQMLPPPGKKVSRAIAEGREKRWNNQHIQSVMTQSILQGESIGEIAKRLAVKVGDSNYKAAVRNARTMTTRAENYGRLDAYKRAEKRGIKLQKQWIATLDHRTRDSHVDLDGEVVPMNDTFSNGMDCPGGMGPPEEVYNCRCTMLSQLAGFEIDATDMNLRNSKLANMSYEEWKEKHWEKQHRTHGNPPKYLNWNELNRKDESDKLKRVIEEKRIERLFKGTEEDYKKQLKERYSNGTNVAKKVYDKYVPNGGKIIDDKYKGASYFSPREKGIYMNFTNDAVNPRGSGTTWFHEHGHWIDYTTERAVGHSETFINAIKNDVRNYERKVMNEQNITMLEARKIIGNELTEKGTITHSLQDIFSGVTGHDYPNTLYGHDWQDADSEKIGRETFAHFFEASFDEKKREMIKSYMPVAWNEFEKALGGLI